MSCIKDGWHIHHGCPVCTVNGLIILGVNEHGDKIYPHEWDKTKGRFVQCRYIPYHSFRASPNYILKKVSDSNEINKE